MATVTGLTAERMIAIEAASVVDGEVVLDNLILTKHDGSTINAGSVRGPTGLPGITTAELNASNVANALAIEAACPAATVRMTMATIADPGWLLLNGNTYTNVRGLYPSLWAKLPVNYKSGVNGNGNDFVSPNMTTHFPIAGIPGTSGGNNNKKITEANLPPHKHNVNLDPPSTSITGSVANGDASHDHALGGSTGGSSVSGTHAHWPVESGFGFVIQNSSGGPHGLDINAGTGATIQVTNSTNNAGADSHTHGLPSVTSSKSISHSHGAGTLAVDIAALNGNTGDGLGSSQDFDVTPAWIAFSFQIKAH